MDNYQITSYSGAEIEALLVKIDELNGVTPEADGLMSAADKAKLDGVNSGAEVNRINRIMLGETEIAPTEKVVTLPLDPAPVLNGTKLLLSGAVYQALTNYYTKAQVNALISGIKQFSAVVVATLPESGEQFTLYLVGPTGTGADKYEEYIWNNDAWLKIGDTSIDISGKADKTELEALAEVVEEKANKDGYYAGMTAGSAENLVGRGSVEAEYQGIRTSAGSEDIGVGAAMIREMRGKSIVWNQLVKNGNFADETIMWIVPSSETTAVSNNILTITRGNATNPQMAQLSIKAVQGHKLLFCGEINPSAATTVRPQYPAIASGVYNVNVPANTWTKIAQIYTVLNSTFRYLYFYYDVNSVLSAGSTIQCRNFQLIDLTLMFGAGYEPATVEEFEAMFPLPYYDYNPGTIINNSATGIKTVGFNLYNHATGKAVLPGKYSDYPYEYEICGTFSTISFEDYAGNVTTPELHNGRFFNVDAPGVLTVTGGNATDTLVHLVWSGWRNYGEPDYAFEQYWENTLQLNLKSITGKLNGEGDSVTIFPEGMRSAGTAYDYLIVDADGYARKAVKAMESRAYAEGDESDATVITDKTNTIYELATPLIYVLDEPLYLGYPVDDFGTEAKLPVDTAELPTGPIRYAVTYPFNAVDPLRRLPMNYISKESAQNLLNAMKTAGIIGDFTMTYNTTTKEYNFTITAPSEPEQSTNNVTE